MARRLSFQKLILGLAFVVLPADHYSANAQSAPQDPAGSNKANSDQPPEKSGDKAGDKGDKGDRKRGDGRGDSRGDGPNRDGRPRNSGPRLEAFLQMLKHNPDMLLEMVKRDGGSLELLSPLMKPEVRKELQLTEAQAAAADKFLKDLTDSLDTQVQAQKNQPEGNWNELYKKWLDSENARFDQFLEKELPEEKRDRLIGIFIQYRNLRALGNRTVTAKLGLNAEETDKLREGIHHIRMETIREIDEVNRRNFQNGSTLQQDKIHEIRQKIDKRIEKEKLLTKEQLEKFDALRGKALPQELLDSLDRPPTPPGPPPKRD